MNTEVKPPHPLVEALRERSAALHVQAQRLVHRPACRAQARLVGVQRIQRAQQLEEVMPVRLLRGIAQ